MPSFHILNDLDLTLYYLVPGLIVLYVRSRFVTGRTPAPSFLIYLVFARKPLSALI